MEQIKPLENLKRQSRSQHGGAREGAGRRKGGKNQETLTRDAALKAFRDKVAAVADQLFITQYNLAKGEQFLFHVKWVGKGTKRHKDVITITSPEIIKLWILGELKDDDDNFYFISTKPANNQALDSLLNRTFGTAQQSIDLTSDSKPLPVPIYGGLSVADRTDRRD